MERPNKYSEAERERIERKEDNVVVNSDESFPASDPPSFNPRRHRRPADEEEEEVAGRGTRPFARHGRACPGHARLCL
jgi:hypothetical protein